MFAGTVATGGIPVDLKNVAAKGTHPAHSKNEVFAKLGRPNTWGDLQMIIGVLGFYIQLFPLYDMDVITRRYIFSKQIQPGTLSKNEEIELMQNIWTPEDQSLLERLKKDIMAGPTLVRTDSSQRLYINRDWSKYGVGAVLL